MIPAHTRKTVLDMWDGYHSLPLSPAAWDDTTTFITKWGRYQYLLAPQGFHTSGDMYACWFNDITVDMVRKTCCIDDCILWNDSIETAFWHMIEYLAHCSNLKKFHFAEEEIEIARLWITKDSVKATKTNDSSPHLRISVVSDPGLD